MSIVLFFFLFMLMAGVLKQSTGLKVSSCDYSETVHGLGTLPQDCHTLIPSYLSPKSTDNVMLTFWRPWTKSTQINGYLCHTIKVILTCSTTFWGYQEISELPQEIYISTEKCRNANVQLDKTSGIPECEWWSTKTTTYEYTIKRPIWGIILENGTVFFPEVGQPVNMLPNYHQVNSLMLIWKEPSADYKRYTCHHVPVKTILCRRTLGTTHGNKEIFRYNCSGNYVAFRKQRSPITNCVKLMDGKTSELHPLLDGALVSEDITNNTNEGLSSPFPDRKSVV